MPTYQYRCSQCQSEQALVHGMLENPAPVCSACGHFCVKIIRTPTIIHPPSSTPASEAISEPASHECGTACVLHRQVRQDHP